jgi:repressor LexA
MTEEKQGPRPPTSIGREEALSPPQRAVLNAIRDYIREEGIPPAFRDIRDRIGLRSTSSIQEHFRRLRYLGAIDQRDGVPRSVRVLWDEIPIAQQSSDVRERLQDEAS